VDPLLTVNRASTLKPRVRNHLIRICISRASCCAALSWDLGAGGPVRLSPACLSPWACASPRAGHEIEDVVPPSDVCWPVEIKTRVPVRGVDLRCRSPYDRLGS
jgi:hypothetical protein